MKTQTTFFVWTVSFVGYIFALIIQSSTIAAQDGFRVTEAVLKAEHPATIITKSENPARLKATNYKRSTFESLIFDDVKVRIYNNNTAISTGSWKRKSKDADGKDTSAAGRFTHIWVKQKYKWLLAGAHYSPDIDLEKLKSGNSQN